MFSTKMIDGVITLEEKHAWLFLKLECTQQSFGRCPPREKAGRWWDIGTHTHTQ